MQVARKFGGFSARRREGGVSRARFALVGLCFVGFVGCASTATTNKSDEAATMQRLRAENIANQRKLEELENQVFVLNSALENRRRAEPPPPVAPALPEIKLTRGERVPPPDNAPASTPASLVDETEVEYAGAAAERGSNKRPVLRIWGANTGEETIVTEEHSQRPTTPGSSREANARREAANNARARGGRRLALARPAGEVSPPSAAASIMSDSAGDEGDEGGSQPASRPAPSPSKPEPARAPTMRGEKSKAARAAEVAKPVAAVPAPVAEDVPAPAPVKLHPTVPAAKNKPPAASAPKASGADLYNNALVDLRAGRHDEAVAGLRAFVRLNAQHDLADNAQYWLGECFYDRKDYPSAAREFARVGSEFPTGNKVPDAQLKLGLSYAAIGNLRAARTALSDVVRRFPQHPAAALAGAKLAAIGGEGASAALTRRPDSKEAR
ncbi:MAG TPA: tol-pal system protein YbgF [Polyangia bacterium]